MNASMFYYNAASDDKPIGPVSLDELRALAADGKVRGNTPVIREGAEEWDRFGEFEAGQRKKEVADKVVDRAARVAAALQTEEFQSFAVGFLIGVIRFLMLPWDIVTNSFRTVSDWGTARFVSIPADRVTSATLGKVAAPILLLVYTVFWLGDVVCMLSIGRPSFSLSLASALTSFVTMGTSIWGEDTSQRVAVAAVQGAFKEVFTVHDFGDRIGWAIKIGIFGYFFTLFWALIGESFSALAALVGLRSDSRRNI